MKKYNIVALSRRLCAIALITVIWFSVAACADDNEDTKSIETPLYSKWPFYVGAAIPGGDSGRGNPFDSSNGQYPLLGHFNVLEAENEMKPENIMPVEWKNSQPNAVYNPSQPYRWTEPDKLVSYAKANNTKIRGHVLFWHEQTPSVFFTTGNAASPLVSREVFYQRMEHHVKTVFEKLKGDVLWWDVVNECVGEDGNARDYGNANIAGSDGSSGFNAVMTAAGLTGDDRYEWVVKAFKLARQYADANGGQDVKLFLTEFSIEEPLKTEKRAGFLRLLDYLIANDAPIDGVGIQGHVQVQFGNDYVQCLSSTIDAITAKKNPVSGKNLVVQVCEMDVSLFANSDQSLTLPADVVTSLLQTQAQLYRVLFDLFVVKHSEGKLEMVVFWGIADGESWLNDFPVEGRTNYPTLFDRQYKPKPAFNELIKGPGNSYVPDPPFTGTVTNPPFEGWGGFVNTEPGRNTFQMAKNAQWNCRITYPFPQEASAYSKFTVTFTITKTADTGNKAKLKFSDRPKDEWGDDNDVTTFGDYEDHDNGSFTYTHVISSQKQLTIELNTYDNANPTADFTIVINSIEFHD